MCSKSLVSSLVLLITVTLCTNLARAQDQSGTRELATEGDTVWVVMNHVKPDKRDQFERFVEEIFWPEAKRLSAAEQRTFTQTRVLYPTEPEADGTYIYFFIMDPVVSGADYDIENALKKMYGEERAKEYAQMVEETAAAPQTTYTVVQSRY